MLRIFIGSDPRQPIAVSVLASSIARHASVPVAITPLVLSTLPITRRGLTEFTFSRFLVPWLCDFRGQALFLDADMVVTGDVAELFSRSDYPHCERDVYVSKDQARFEWPSAMLFNCENCKVLTPEYVDNPKNVLMDLSWATMVGDFGSDWNHCVGYAPPRHGAKLYHFTKGLPIWRETRGLPEDVVYHDAYKHMVSTCSHAELMGNSVHVQKAS